MPERLNDEAFAQNALYALRCLLEGGQTVDVAFDAARVVRAVAAAHLAPTSARRRARSPR